MGQAYSIVEHPTLEVETQYRLHGQMSQTSSYFLQLLAGLRRYRNTPNKEVIDKFITPESVKFLDFSIRALDMEPVPYDVSMVYQKITAEDYPALKRETLKKGLSNLSSLVLSIKEGGEPRSNEVDSALRFLMEVIPVMDNEVADLGKRLYGSWISVAEGP